MYCNKCGKEIEEGKMYCKECLAEREKNLKTSPLAIVCLVAGGLGIGTIVLFPLGLIIGFVGLICGLLDVVLPGKRSYSVTTTGIVMSFIAVAVSGYLYMR